MTARDAAGLVRPLGSIVDDDQAVDPPDRAIIAASLESETLTPRQL